MMMNMVGLARGRGKRGFTLVELAIVLGVASLLFAGLWRLMASGNAQLRDQAVADQQKQLIAATQSFLASKNGQSIIMGLGAQGTTSLTLPATANGTCVAGDYCSYLPSGFYVDTTNAYGQKYTVRVRKDSNETAGTNATAYSFMILTTGGSNIPDTSGGRISSMIGNDGGFLYSVQACSTSVAANNMACGAYGAWAADVTALYGYGAGTSGHVASRTYMGLNAAQSSIWLARSTATTAPLFSNTQPDYNTMQTNMYFLTSSAITSLYWGTASAQVLPTSGNDMYLSGNTIYGGMNQQESSGMITNVYKGVFGLTAAQATAQGTTGGAANLLTVYSPCSAKAGNTCSYTAFYTNGDLSVLGQVTADWLKAGYFVYTSDIRLKRDIQEIKNPLESLAKLRGIAYISTEDDQKRYGLIAQEVEKVYPELVHPIGKGYFGLDYIGMIGPIVGAINQLKQQNDELRQTVETQGKTIKALQDKIEAKSKK